MTAREKTNMKAFENARKMNWDEDTFKRFMEVVTQATNEEAEALTKAVEK